MTCDGVTVNAGDTTAADSDGVVVVPRARAQEVLKLAKNGFQRTLMHAVIRDESIVEGGQELEDCRGKTATLH